MSLRQRVLIPVRLAALLMGAWSVACVVSCSSPATAKPRQLRLGDFSNPPADLKTDVVEMSTGVLDGPQVEADVVVEDAGGVARKETRKVVREKLADGTTVVDANTPIVIQQNVDAGKSWPVDALVGQINGHPVFADSFFDPIDDQLLRAAANPDRVVGREQFIRTVKAQFKETVDSELVVAEAESQLSPEQQQGLLAWLRSAQEATIAERGGSRAAAEASLQAEEDKTLDEFMEQRRQVALAGRLLNQKIEPRAIVSWREVLQAYERDRKIYNPPEQIAIGRIKFDTATEADKIERMKKLVAEGKTFSELVKEFSIPDNGVWQKGDLPANGLEGLPLNDTVIARLKNLKVGQVSEPIQKDGFISWLAVAAIERPQVRTVYDRDLQLSIYDQLRGIRKTIERQRYIGTLRSRWVTDDIGEMEERLIAFALERYWR